MWSSITWAAGKQRIWNRILNSTARLLPQTLPGPGAKIMQSIPSSAITDKIHAKPELSFPFVSNFQNAFPQWTGVMFHSRKYPGKCAGCLLGMQRYCSFYQHLRPVRKRAYCASCGQYLLTHPYRRKRPIPFKQAWGLWHRNRLSPGAQRHYGVTEFRYEDGIFYASVFIQCCIILVRSSRCRFLAATLP